MVYHIPKLVYNKDRCFDDPRAKGYRLVWGRVQVPVSLHAVVEPIGRANTTSPAGRRNAGSPGVTAQIDHVLAGVAAQNQPIPRANFVPAAGTVRPRSRSFSGMTSGSGLSIRTEALSDKRCARNMF